MPKIVFFNHYHRGDMHTQKEYVKQVMRELSNFEFEYKHYNPSKLTNEFGISHTGVPSQLNHKQKFYEQGDTLFVNTWVGCDWDIFCKHGGINMHTIYEGWGIIFNKINDVFGCNIKLLDSKEEYLPRINYNFIDKEGIDYYIENNQPEGRMLICNNNPNSGQSFAGNMEEYIVALAEENPDVHFICTDNISKDVDNIIYTKDIIGDVGETDLLEVSYLSRFCDVIIGKNSGPYVFCETYDNFMDENKTFISFNTKNPAYDTIMETMSNGLALKCKYTAVPIINNRNLTDQDKINILSAIVNI